MNRHNHGRGLAASILVALLGVSLLPTSAFAGSLSTASAFLRPGTQYLGDSAGQVFQLRVRNSGSGAPIGAVRITRPSLLWTVTGCPTGPAGWMRTAAADSCEYTSNPGDADDIPAGSARSFRLKATTGGASHNVWGTWAVTVSSGDDLTVPGNNAPASPMPMGLRTRAFSFQIVDAVISTSSAAVGSACPSPEKSAIAGSSASFLIICGRNRTNAAQTTLNQNSKLLGTMFTAHGSFTGGSVPSSSDVVVLGYWNSVQVNANPGSGKAVRLRVGSAFNATSPVTRIAGFIAIGGPSGDTATVANNDSYNTNEDTQLVVAASGVLGNDTDPEFGCVALAEGHRPQQRLGNHELRWFLPVHTKRQLQRPRLFHLPVGPVIARLEHRHGQHHGSRGERSNGGQQRLVQHQRGHHADGARARSCRQRQRPRIRVRCTR